MSVHLPRQIEKLKRLILSIGAMVEEAVASSIRVIQARDIDLAEQVIAGDKEIDVKEVDVEEECLSTLCLHQPVAHDLRFIVAVLKMNNDLERIGDLAKSVAKQGIALAGEPPMSEIEMFGVYTMASKAQSMLKKCLDALVNLDTGLANDVRKMDDDVDDIHAAMYDKVANAMRESPHRIESLIRLLTLARHFERIADHSVNIAKDVVYLVEGRIVRHRRARAEIAAMLEQEAE